MSLVLPCTEICAMYDDSRNILSPIIHSTTRMYTLQSSGFDCQLIEQSRIMTRTIIPVITTKLTTLSGSKKTKDCVAT